MDLLGETVGLSIAFQKGHLATLIGDGEASEDISDVRV